MAHKTYYGTHNSLTYAKLIWWQRPFSWLINPFCRCQNKSLKCQILGGIRYFDIQIAMRKGKWMVSHGIAWYNAGEIKDLLGIINYYANITNNPIYVAIGLDKHYFQSKENRKRQEEKIRQFYHEIQDLYKKIIFYKLYSEGITLECDTPIRQFTERYWSLAWAKMKVSQKKRITKWLFFLPIPKLWSFLYFEDWEQEAIGYHNCLITDFV